MAPAAATARRGDYRVLYRIVGHEQLIAIIRIDHRGRVCHTPLSRAPQGAASGQGRRVPRLVWARRRSPDPESFPCPPVARPARRAGRHTSCAWSGPRRRGTDLGAGRVVGRG
ncbi:type II toxin-antitoxin system RelE/ParE family toxin [Intrasporangium sp.]|uniref:type II toxin-antitoxin system RelE family toxin n=1 Tax=Intrasporangium sp. TaxID=1925024 RepID=UPI0034649F95